MQARVVSTVMGREPLSISWWVGRQVAEVRRAIRWTQADLGRVVGVTQSVISDIELGRQADLSLRRAEALLDAMGARLRISIDPPRVAEALQRDLVHVHCSAFVARRMRAAGWDTRAEVEVGGDRSRGWIDLLAYQETRRSLLVIEIKTEIRDVGDLERALSWYEREAWAAGRRQGWQPRRVGSAVLLLATAENDRLAHSLRSVLADRFPCRAAALTELLASGEPIVEGRCLAMIDPRSRRRAWIRPLQIDGRRSQAPYRDYLDALRSIETPNSRRRSRSAGPMTPR